MRQLVGYLVELLGGVLEKLLEGIGRVQQALILQLVERDLRVYPVSIKKIRQNHTNTLR